MTAAASTATATAGYRWPQGIPAWQEQELEQLSSEGALGSVPPQLLGGIDDYTSDFGLEGVGINPTSNDGGYFGEHATGDYPGGHVSRQELLTPSPAAFATEAEIAASALSNYGHTVIEDLNEYSTGTPGQTSSETTFLEQTVLPQGASSGATLTGFDPFAGLTWAATWAKGHLLPSTTNISLIPGSSVSSGIMKTVTELLVVGLGGVLVLFGLYKAAGSPGEGAAEKAAAAGAAA